MFKLLQKTIDSRKYNLIHNGNPVKFEVQRIKGFKDYVNNIAKAVEFDEGLGFFVYNEYNFASFGASEVLDIVFVDWDGKVTHIEESFPMNKITKNFKNSKYIYIFPKLSVKTKKILINDTLRHEYFRTKKKNEIKLSDFL